MGFWDRLLVLCAIPLAVAILTGNRLAFGGLRAWMPGAFNLFGFFACGPGAFALGLTLGAGIFQVFGPVGSILCGIVGAMGFAFFVRELGAGALIVASPGAGLAVAAIAASLQPAAFADPGQHGARLIAISLLMLCGTLWATAIVFLAALTRGGLDGWRAKPTR